MGMMHEGYFVGRKELTAWIQANFQASFLKIEDLASGVVYCQIVDSIYPEVKVMSRVKREAKLEVDFIHNFKELQKAFSKKKIDRYIDVDKLSKRSFQTNMEFLQFMKCYWDMHAPGGDISMHDSVHPPLGDQTQGRNDPVTAPAKHLREEKATTEPRGVDRGPGAGPKRVVGGALRQTGPSTGTVQQTPGVVQQQLALEVTELKMSVENLERERDFYYSKLREVEVLCQNNENSNHPFLQQVLDILYKTDDADEFISPEEVVPLA